MITSDHGFIIATPTKCGTTTLEELTRRHGGGRVSRGGVELPSFRIDRSESPRRQHSMVPVAAFRDHDRWLLIRNPFTRYMSQYEYLRAPHNYSKFGAREIQGRDWLGYSKGRPMVGKWYDRAPMTFPQFLHFIAKSRTIYGDRRWTKRRGNPAHDPRAWRSPWIWLDPLDRQMGALAAVPGGGAGTVEVVRMENLWGDLMVVRDRYGLSTLNLKASIHANKTLTYKGRTPQDYWEFGCRRFTFSDDQGGVSVRGRACGECAACRIGVVEESAALGYAV